MFRHLACVLLFPEDTAHAVSFWERDTKNYPNVIKIVGAIFKKIISSWGSSEELFSGAHVHIHQALT
jgi:hypothetical protein